MNNPVKQETIVCVQDWVYLPTRLWINYTLRLYLLNLEEPKGCVRVASLGSNLMVIEGQQNSMYKTKVEQNNPHRRPMTTQETRRQS